MDNSEHPIWDRKVRYASFMYNTSMNRAHRDTPYFLMHGRDPMLPIENILLGSPNDTWKEPGQDKMDDFKEELVTLLRENYAIAKENIDIYQEKMKESKNVKTKTPKIKV